MNHYDRLKCHDWIRIETSCDGIEDSHISQYSLISMLSYIATKKTTNTNAVQKLYKVSFLTFCVREVIVLICDPYRYF